ncbi:CaiB/BaiF CoA transferase family protein [Actinacidiphila sp. ITFR-21]|uniref:CaiB/BaiF CoA transferase family protein n=1 Tax=Actinacidiphila sp. ITFR-21 TaxID=3075199 RepID=UPI002889414D|nr:CaiB/BaiF CoA-transferase family protein [Streptomyces sp. ITFR-21]WNI14292.1 CaiB/BaiF CoA-transferase family protein [Streptomyces sp. ITFR-21]
MGPLTGIRVVELAGSAPAAFAGTLLADFGADVVRIDRAAAGAGDGPADVPAQGGADAADRSRPVGNPLARGRRSVALDLKHDEGVAAALSLIDRADVLVEGFRPGTAERLGLGPQTALERNPALVYARVTGWGQTGAWAARAAHDLAVLAVTGALDTDPATGDPLPPPTAYLSSFAGGGMAHVQAILAALYERSRSGLGQVVDTALADAAALVTTLVHQWRAAPGVHTVTDAPHYTLYRCADGRHVAVAAIEPRLYANLLLQLGLLGDPALPDRGDPSAWPALRALLAGRFGERESAHWAKVFADVDACVVVVSTADEAPAHPQLADRGTFVDVGGHLQPGPASRFGRRPPTVPRPAPYTGEHTAEVLREWRRDRPVD